MISERPTANACSWCSALVVLLAAGCAPAPRPKDRQLAPDELQQMRYQMADQLVAERDYDRALPYLRGLIAQHPQDLRLRLLLGIVLSEKDMHGVAARELQAVVDAAPRSAPARAAYGVLLDKMGRHRQAERNHRLAVKLAPDEPRHHNNLGFCLFLQKRFDEAREALEQAIRLDPGMRLAYNNLGFVNGLQGKDAAAMTAFSQAGSKALALTNMGLVAQMRGHPQRARQYYEQALRASPQYKPALQNLRALQPGIGPGSSDAGRARPGGIGPGAAAPATEEDEVQATGVDGAGDGNGGTGVDEAGRGSGDPDLSTD